MQDRIENARRLGWLSDLVTKTGSFVIADFVCPTEEARFAFMGGGEAFVIWLDRIDQGRFDDTNQLFQPPKRYHVRVTAEGTPEHWAERIATQVRPLFDPKKPTALVIGCFEPFHLRHRALIVQSIRRVGQVCIAIRDSGRTDASNPLAFEHVRSRIEHGLRDFDGRFVVVPFGKTADISIDGTLGHPVERIELDVETDAISAIANQERLGLIE